VRSGQLLSMDALISIVLIIMIFSTVSATSESLRNEITSMIGWYERANIADNMLDVLTKSPGEPEDWEEHPRNVIVVGIKDRNSGFVSYSRVRSLLRLKTEMSVLASLNKMSAGKDFWLSFRVMSSLVTPPEVEVNITPGAPNYISACDPASLPADRQVIAKCESGNFKFSGYQPLSPPPWWLNNYSNAYSVCILSTTFVGDNFKLTIGDYFGVNGSLSVGSDGHVDASEWYVTGDTKIGDSGYATSHGNAYIGGDLEIWREGHYTVDGSLYVGGQTYVHNGGYLYVSGNLYSREKLTLEGGSSVSVENSIYVFSDAKIGTRGLTLNGDFYVKGSYDMFRGGTLNVNGLMYVGDSMRVIGDTTVGELYVGNGLTIDEGKTLEVNGDAYVIGNINIRNGKLIVHGNLYVEGNINILDYGNYMEVDRDLYITGSIIVPDPNDPGRFYSVGGTISNTIPSGISKPRFTTPMPLIRIPPCIASVGKPTLELTPSNLSNIFFISTVTIGDIIIINGSLSDESTASVSMENSLWIERSVRTLPLVTKIYSPYKKITRSDTLPMEVYNGVLTGTVWGTLNITLPATQAGELLIVSAFSSRDKKGVGAVYILKDSASTSVVSKIFLVNESGEVYREYSNCNPVIPNWSAVKIPLACLIPNVGSDTNFVLWVYKMDGFQWIELEDESNLRAVLDYRYGTLEVELRVWDEG